MVWVLALVAVLSACASTKDEATEKEIEKTPDQVYAEAKEAVANKEYKKAAERYEELEKNYPYWENINVALMEKAQVEYDGRRYEDALQTLDRFIELYPADAQIDHAFAQQFAEQVAHPQAPPHALARDRRQIGIQRCME